MADSLVALAMQSGITNPKYVLIRLSDGAYWNTSGTPAFEDYNATNIASYGIAATEIGSTGVYKASNPSVTTSAMMLFVAAAGSSLAVSDIVSNVRYEGHAGVVRADNRDGDAIPSTSGGVTVQPLQSLVDERVSETTIQAYKNEAGWTIGPVVVTDASGNAVDLTAYTTLRLIIEDQYGTDLMTTTSITVSGTGNNQWTATGTSAVTTTAPARHRWALRGYNTGVEVVLGRGIVTVTDAADE